MRAVYRGAAMRRLIAACLFSLVSATLAFGDATIPTKDIAGAKDNPLLKRYEGSFIVSYDRVAFTDFNVPLSPLEATDPDAEVYE